MYPAPTLPAVVPAAREPRRVHVLDRHPGPPRPLEGKRPFPVPGDHDELLGVGIEERLQVRPRARGEHGEAGTVGQTLSQTRPLPPRRHPRSARLRIPRPRLSPAPGLRLQIGRASCMVRVEIASVAVSLTNTNL